MINLFAKYKIIFYLLNTILIILYLYPGSLLGCFFFDNCHKQPQITRDFVVSSNHVYVFSLITLIGIFTYLKSKKIKSLAIYLVFLSIFLELMHIVIPHRGFELGDLFGNLVGTILSFILYSMIKIYVFFKK